MKPFIHPDFLLETDTAQALYHEHAKDQPIVDYHCHLPPDLITKNHRFQSLTEIWLYGDHYKWRAMRSNGVQERFCTGDASDYEKFQAWARTVPHTLRNPLYHWTHLELADPFGISDRLLNERTAAGVYEECNEKLKTAAFSTQGLLAHFGVEVVCTTDDPVDSLEHHVAHQKTKPKTRLLPTFRPDRALAVENLATWNAWVNQLEAASNVSVGSYEQLLEALLRRHAFFHEVGCRLSDHGIDTVYTEPCTRAEASAIFDAARAGKALDGSAVLKWKSALLYEFGVMDHARGWVQQFHIGALRNNNTRLLDKLGPDTGFDSIGDDSIARPLARFLDRLDRTDQLAKTILYNLNPRDNELFATMIGNFQDGSVPGKLQYGSAWWFLDQLDGMERQMNALSNLGLLSRFVGMLTDSRSFLSYSRHEYFRRLLCNMLGNDVRRGLLPDDRMLLGGLVKAVCYQNARDYFGFAA
jgi:glucuronate isomerase